MRMVGILLLALGFFGGAFEATRQADAVGAEWETIRWPWFGGYMILGVGGIVMIRAARADARGQTHKVETDLATMTTALERLTNNVGALRENQAATNVYDVHQRIDADLATDLAEFADARETLITLYGLQPYADVMSEFAGAERSINRAWSASADGYIDEVWICLERAHEMLARARDRLGALAKPAS